MDDTEHPNAEDYFNRAQRAEQECAELQAQLDGLKTLYVSVVKRWG